MYFFSNCYDLKVYWQKCQWKSNKYFIYLHKHIYQHIVNIYFIVEKYHEIYIYEKNKNALIYSYLLYLEWENILKFSMFICL